MNTDGEQRQKHVRPCRENPNRIRVSGEVRSASNIAEVKRAGVRNSPVQIQQLIDVIINRRVRCFFVFETLFERHQPVLGYFVRPVKKADRVWVGRRLIEAAKNCDGREIDRCLPCVCGVKDWIGLLPDRSDALREISSGAATTRCILLGESVAQQVF